MILNFIYIYIYVRARARACMCVKEESNLYFVYFLTIKYVFAMLYIKKKNK